MPEVTVIGSGVSGLSSAVALQKAGFDVRIITRDMPEFTTSMAAGAVWYGGGAIGRTREWAEISLDHFQALATKKDAGVQIVRLREFFPHEEPDPWFKDLLQHFKRVEPDKLTIGSQAGFEMDVPIIEPPTYLQYLVDLFEAQGGSFVIDEIKAIDELKYEYELIVNCTGVWAKQVAGDPSVYPIRGQTIVVEAESIKDGYMDDKSFTYIFPRKDGVLIGGVAEPNVWDLEIDSGLTSDIVARCSQIEPAIADAKILKQFVGLRPGRDQVRLEVEKLTNKSSVIHNYGHAGVGYTMSWGCAQEVVTLAKNLISD